MPFENMFSDFCFSPTRLYIPSCESQQVGEQKKMRVHTLKCVRKAGDVDISHQLIFFLIQKNKPAVANQKVTKP